MINNIVMENRTWITQAYLGKKTAGNFVSHLLYDIHVLQ